MIPESMLGSVDWRQRPAMGTTLKLSQRNSRHTLAQKGISLPQEHLLPMTYNEIPLLGCNPLFHTWLAKKWPINDSTWDIFEQAA